MAAVPRFQVLFYFINVESGSPAPTNLSFAKSNSKKCMERVVGNSTIYFGNLGASCIRQTLRESCTLTVNSHDTLCRLSSRKTMN